MIVPAKSKPTITTTTDDERRDVRSAVVADWNTARGGNTERALTAAVGPPPRDPYRHALTMRPPQKVRPFFCFLNNYHCTGGAGGYTARQARCVTHRASLRARMRTSHRASRASSPFRPPRTRPARAATDIRSRAVIIRWIEKFVYTTFFLVQMAAFPVFLLADEMQSYICGFAKVPALVTHP